MLDGIDPNIFIQGGAVGIAVAMVGVAYLLGSKLIGVFERILTNHLHEIKDTMEGGFTTVTKELHDLRWTIAVQATNREEVPEPDAPPPPPPPPGG